MLCSVFSGASLFAHSSTHITVGHVSPYTFITREGDETSQAPENIEKDATLKYKLLSQSTYLQVIKGSLVYNVRKDKKLLIIFIIFIYCY